MNNYRKQNFIFLMMRNKMMMAVFFLFAQSLFSQITVTEGAAIHIDGKTIVSTSKDAEKEINSETILTGKIKVVNKNRFDPDENVSQKKIKKSELKEFAKVSPKKKAVTNKIKTKKIERLVFIPYPNKSSISSSSSESISSVLPVGPTQVKLVVFQDKIKTNTLFFSDRKQSFFLHETFVFHNHFHSSLSVRPPPSA